LRVLRIDVIATGQTPRAQIVAANHLGYVDILVLAAESPVVFVAKHEVRDWPFFGWFARMAGTRFIDRAKRGDVARVAGELAPALNAGVSVVLFLEGTSTDGRTVLPFKSSLLQPAVQNNWPVLPAALAYAVGPNRSAANEVCWWGDMTLAPHLWNLATLPWIKACVAWGDPILRNDRKQLAVELRAACESLLGRERGRLARNELLAGQRPVLPGSLPAVFAGNTNAPR
jgi:1-acyl-sn-glycerol-3-phosphate acyltransferase